MERGQMDWLHTAAPLRSCRANLLAIHCVPVRDRIRVFIVLRRRSTDCRYITSSWFRGAWSIGACTFERLRGSHFECINFKILAAVFGSVRS